MKNWNEQPSQEASDSVVSEARYREVLSTVYKRNKEVLQKFSVIELILFAAMLVLSFVSEAETHDRYLYIVMIFVSIGFYMAFRRIDNSRKSLIIFLNYFFFLVIYAYSILITLNNPTTCAVAFHVFLILMPELLIDMPARLISLMTVVSLVFGFLVYKFKPAEVAYMDICNVAWVLFLSIVLTAQHVKLRINGLVVQQQVESERDRDSLTGFLTKRASKREIQKKMASNPVGAFVFLDLDNFKYINDTFGHDFGDEVLRKLADYIASYNHTTEVCGRFGGDEFLVYISDFDCKEAVFQRVHFLLNNLKNNLDYPDLDVHPKLSAGIAFYPDDGTDYDELLRHADSAMYYSKHHGKARVTAYLEAKTKMKCEE